MLTCLVAVVGIGVLLMADGWLAGAEVTLRAVQHPGTRQRDAQGDHRRRYLGWECNGPGRMCGAISLIRALGAILAGALGGFTAVEGVVPTLLTILHPDVPTRGQRLALGALVMLVASLVLLLEALVPKALAVRYPEAVACWGVGILGRLSQALSVLLRGLTGAHHICLKPIEMENTLQVPEALAEEVMARCTWAQVSPGNNALNMLLTNLRPSHLSQGPGYGNSYADHQAMPDLTAVSVAKVRERPLEVAQHIRPALVSSDCPAAGGRFHECQSERLQLPTVIGVHGEEEIVMIERLDGQLFLIDGAMFVRDLNRLCGFRIPESDAYTTLAEFLQVRLCCLPHEGEMRDHGGYTYTIVQTDGRRVAKVRAERRA